MGHGGGIGHGHLVRPGPVKDDLAPGAADKQVVGLEGGTFAQGRPQLGPAVALEVASDMVLQSGNPRFEFAVDDGVDGLADAPIGSGFQGGDEDAKDGAIGQSQPDADGNSHGRLNSGVLNFQ